jgi:hypothetical protein
VTGGSGEVGSPFVIEAGGMTVVTSLTRPGSPYAGQVITETDTNRVYRYVGGAWKIVHDPAPTSAVFHAPVGNVDLTATTFTSWITTADLTVPPWATKLRMKAILSGVYLSSASATCIITTQARIDGAAGTSSNVAAATLLTQNQRSAAIIPIGEFTVTPGDSITPSVWGTVSSGNTVRADTSSRLFIDATWEE